jgi:hypothetical protein
MLELADAAARRTLFARLCKVKTTREIHETIHSPGFRASCRVARASGAFMISVICMKTEKRRGALEEVAY